MDSKKSEKYKGKKPDLVTNLKEGNISLILDSYDDIFSDFDPRDYSERSLSDDFLIECKKAAIDKNHKLELRFLVPKSKRNMIEEVLIKKRLKEHFSKHFEDKRRELSKIRFSGFMWFVLGSIIMILSTLIFPHIEEGFLFRLLFIISEPASWFFFWEGLEKVFITSKKTNPHYNFYKKMSKAEIHFIDY